MQNRIMMNIEVPSFWHMTPGSDNTPDEKEHFAKLTRQVLYLNLVELKNSQSTGLNDLFVSTSVHKIADLFTKYGDINVSINLLYCLTLSIDHKMRSSCLLCRVLAHGQRTDGYEERKIG